MELIKNDYPLSWQQALEYLHQGASIEDNNGGKLVYGALGNLVHTNISGQCIQLNLGIVIHRTYRIIKRPRNAPLPSRPRLLSKRYGDRPTHYDNNEKRDNRTHCGFILWMTIKTSRDKSKVTCKNCLRGM